jgi:hypothetical protein
MNAPRVIGIHPVSADEPVHLVEVEVGADVGEIDWCSFTQPLAGRDQGLWQVPYDERMVPGRPGHWCFFFHYLDVRQPLLSYAGPMELPPETPVPQSLRFVAYRKP